MTDGRRTLARAPLFTLGCLVLAALVAGVPGLADALIYERSAVAAGEWWRFVGGSWVHYSSWHLVANCLGFAIVGGYLERDHRRVLIRIVGGGAVASVIAVHLVEPQTARYGGLSGVVTAAVAFAAADGLRSLPRARPLFVLALVLLVLKLVVDVGEPRELVGAPGVSVSSAAHLGALLVALLVTAGPRRSRGTALMRAGAEGEAP